MSRLRKVAQIVALISVFFSVFHVSSVSAQANSRYFPETNQTVSGRFLEYWEDNGGLMQQGYPISPEMQEKSAIDGKTYTVQYFERAVFEKHPENPRPFDVLLSLLGVMRYQAKYPNGAPNQRANDEVGSVLFPETGKRVGGSFLVYFNQFGGVPQQGLPISDEFQERSDLDGKVRVVQYFERAVFEWNPSNTPPYNVLLAQLGTFAYKAQQQTIAAQVPLLEPALPGPLDPTKGQYSPMASGRYLIWSEGHVGGSHRQILSDFDIRALDMATNQQIIVTDAPGNQLSPSLDGSLVAWRNETTNCSGCPVDTVQAKDLATGKQYAIEATNANGNNAYIAEPVVAGRYVAGSALVDTVHEGVLAYNVDNDSTVIAYTSQLSANDSAIVGVQGSGRFLLWGEISYAEASPGNPVYPYSAYVYDMVTGKLTKIYSNPGTDSPLSTAPVFSLDGDRLVVADRAGNITLMDLVKGTQTDVPFTDDVFRVDMYGDRLLIWTNDLGTDISGLDLTRPEQGAVKLLETDPGVTGPNLPKYSVTVGGDWLVWSDHEFSAKLTKKKLDLRPPTPTQAPIVLPKPDKHRAYYLVAGYSSILIYWDCPVTSFASGQSPCRLRGFDRNFNTDIQGIPNLTPEQAVEVVLAPGGLLVWRWAGPPECAACPAPGIYALDLFNGKSYEVATGLISRYSVTAYGKNVAWIEKDQQSERIMHKNLDTGKITLYREVGTAPPTLSNLKLSDAFLVWNEQDTEHPEGQRSAIVVLNTQTGEMKSIFSYDWSSFTARSLRIALDVSRVVVKYGNSFFVLNLYTDERIELDGQQYVTWMELRDEVLLYGSVPFDPGPNGVPRGVGVYALHLSEPAKVYTIIPRHVTGAEDIVRTLSFISLVYSDRNAQQSRLKAIELPYALLNRGTP